MKTHLWKIRIDDGFCEYEYPLLATNMDVSIAQIYEHVRKLLEAKPAEGQLLNTPTKPEL